MSIFSNHLKTRNSNRASLIICNISRDVTAQTVKVALRHTHNHRAILIKVRTLNPATYYVRSVQVKSINNVPNY